MPRLLQNPDDLRTHVALAPRIQPCSICGNSMLATANSPVDEKGSPICFTCGIDETVRKLRGSA